MTTMPITKRLKKPRVETRQIRTSYCPACRIWPNEPRSTGLLVNSAGKPVAIIDAFLCGQCGSEYTRLVTDDAAPAFGSVTRS